MPSWLRWSILATTLALAVLVGAVLSQAFPSSEAVRLRNALVLEAVDPSFFAWTPADRPASFRRDAAAPEEFAEIVASLGVHEIRGDFEKARRIAQHLVERAKDKGPIQSDLATTYRRIREEGYGYCADFIDVFVALANAAGLETRRWAFSFDGFGGQGHIFVEVFDERLKKWIFLDVYNNFYVVDATTAAPLAALEFRDALIAKSKTFRLLPLGNGRPGFIHTHKAIEYYERGLPEWYLWWGTNAFEYDSHPVVKTIGRVSETGREFTGIALGIHPEIKAMRQPGNQRQIERMYGLKRLLNVALLSGLILGFALAVQVGAALFYRRRNRAAKNRGASAARVQTS